MNLLRRLTTTDNDEQRYSLDTYIGEYVAPFLNQFQFNGHTYPIGMGQTYDGQPIEKAPSTLPGYSAALKACPPAFAAELVRASVLSQARFTFRNKAYSKQPRRLFGTTALGQLEAPWPGATTGELLSRMEWHAGLAGNAYVTKVSDRFTVRLRVLRPDWVAMAYGSDLEPDHPQHALDGHLIGYFYQQGGLNPGNKAPIHTLLPEEVAHWAPIPDPECAGLGMSWVTPAVREIQADKAATTHKLEFFRNGATPNLVVKGLSAPTQALFDELVNGLESRHAGSGNAYRTLYLSGGADATIVGSDLKQIDFAAVQGAGETRLSVLSRVPAALLGISESLAGSPLNTGNFGMARRTFSDTWLSPSLQDLCASMSGLVQVPSDAELWFDTADIPLLREDAKDAADIEQTKASTIRQLIDAGFEPSSVVAAVQGQNMNLLKHTGLYSIQLQEPGSPKLPAPGPDVLEPGDPTLAPMAPKPPAKTPA